MQSRCTLHQLVTFLVYMVQNSTGASGTDDSKRPLISSDQKVVEYLTFYSLVGEFNFLFCADRVWQLVGYHFKYLPSQEKEEKEKEDGNGPKGMIED